MRRRGGVLTWLMLAAVHALALAVATGVVISYIGPTALRPLLLFFLLIVGASAVVWPGSSAGLVVIVGIVVSYVALTSLSELLDLGASPSAVRVLLIASCLYVAHSAEALRGAVGRADLDRSVLVRWLRRLAEALLPGLAAGALVLSLPTGDGANPLWLLGAAAVIGAAAVPAFRVQRRPWRTAAGPAHEPDEGAGKAAATFDL